MYLSTLTDDELLRYAGTQNLSPLEAQLVKRWEEFIGETSRIETDREGYISNLCAEIGDLEDEIDQLRVDLANAQDEIEKMKGEM